MIEKNFWENYKKAYKEEKQKTLIKSFLLLDSKNSNLLQYLNRK